MHPYETSDRFENHLRRRRLYQQAVRQTPSQPLVVTQTCAVEVKQSIELLRQLIDRARESAWLTLEGDLSRFNSGGLTGLVREDTSRDGLGDDLFAPLHSRVSIPLHSGNVQQLKHVVLQHIGIRSHIVHLYMDCDDRRLFAANNKFRQCTLFGGWIPADFLAKLQEDGVIAIN